MPHRNLKIQTAGAFALGGAVASGWYTAATAVVAGTGYIYVPMLGAIAIASFIPMALVNRNVRRKARRDQLSLSQRLRVLEKHAMTNVVGPDDRLVEVNDQFLNLTGYDRETLVGLPVGNIYSDRAHHLSEEIRLTLRRGDVWQGQTPLRRADGSIITTHTTVMPLQDELGNFCGSISARTDVTQQNKLMAENQISMTLHELRDDVWIVEEKNLCFRYMNRAAMARFGWNEKSYANKTLAEVTKAQEADEILEACKEMRRLGVMLSRMEVNGLGSSFEVTIKLLRDQMQEGRFLILLNDITDRLAQEQVKADFISMVSHELRSPMTSIKGSMGLLLSGAAGELPRKARGLLEISHRNADRLVLIINDILDLEKIATGRMEFTKQVVTLSDMIGEAVLASSMSVKNFGQCVEIEGLPKETVIETDPNRIIQVLTNLISNASKFSKPNATIRVKSEMTEEGLKVSVENPGPGIDKSEHHKIFKRFADLANSDRSTKGGTGLGLSICKAIIENLDGTIGFESQKDVSTTFYFILPSNTVTEKDVSEGATALRSAG